MSRRGKGARLWLRPERRDTKTGKLRERSSWIIRDNGKFIATGCAPEETAQAEQCLANYIADKYQPLRKIRAIENIPIADVLSIYVDDKRSEQADIKNFDLRIKRLAGWWGNKMLSEVTSDTCKRFEGYCGTRGSARRELEDLRAAINHHCKAGLHREIVRVTLPPKGRSRDRWLSRDEAARFIWACWRYRETQKIHRGDRKGKLQKTDRRPLRHIARFAIIGLYSGSRSGAIFSASPYKGEGRSWVDLERGVFHRLAEGKRVTNKRQPPVRLPPNLLAHMRRWTRQKVFATYFVEWNGAPVASIKTGFATAVELAGLPGKITPHTLRHTAATWLMQAGVSIWESAGYLGMSPEILEKVYGHHHPDYQSNAVAAFGKHRQSVGIPVGEGKSRV